MAAQPTKLALAPPDKLVMEWSDGAQREYTYRELRDRCPCANCREKHSATEAPSPLLPVLSAAETQPLKITGVRPVGNYAYQISFSDGHDTGIYPLDLLRELGRRVA